MRRKEKINFFLLKIRNNDLYWLQTPLGINQSLQFHQLYILLKDQEYLRRILTIVRNNKIIILHLKG